MTLTRIWGSQHEAMPYFALKIQYFVVYFPFPTAFFNGKALSAVPELLLEVVKAILLLK